MYGEIVWLQLLKNAASNIKQVLETAHNKAAAIRPPTTHHENCQIRRTRHAGHCWRCRDELISDVLLWPPSHGRERQDVQLEPTYSSSVPIRDVILSICRKQWTIGRCGERGLGISALIAQHDDDDEDVYIIIHSFQLNKFQRQSVALMIF